MPQELDDLLNDDAFTDEEKERLREAAQEPAPAENEAPAAPEDALEEPAAAPSEENIPEQEQKPKPKWLSRVDAANRKRVAAEAAVAEEKARAEGLEKRIAEQEARWKTAEERLNAFMQAKPQEKPAEPKIPDIDTDPLGHLAARLGTHEKVLTEVFRRVQEDREVQEVNRRWSSDLAVFLPNAQDFPQALDYLAQKRTEELSAIGYQPAHINEILSAEARDISRLAAQSGKNAAEIFYSLAKSRGWAGQQPQQQETAAADLNRIAQGQKKVQATANNGGGATAGLSLADLADMPYDRYAALVDKAGGLRKLVSGLS